MIKYKCGKIFWNIFENNIRVSQSESQRKMAKFSQKIVLFIEPALEAWSTPSKIGNLFVNRFAIDEDANHEILKIYQFEKWDGIRLEGQGLLD